MTLNDLQPGEAGTVRSVRGQGAFRRRLLELGLLPGASVVRSGQSLAMDPLTFRVRGAVLGLRRRDAECVEVDR